MLQLTARVEVEGLFTPILTGSVIHFFQVQKYPHLKRHCSHFAGFPAKRANSHFKFFLFSKLTFHSFKHADVKLNATPPKLFVQ